MADPHAPSIQAATPLLSDDAFVADRQRFWGSFTSFGTYAVIAVVLVVIGLAVFLT